MAAGAYWEGGVKQTKLSGLRRCDTVNFEVGMPLYAESFEDLCAKPPPYRKPTGTLTVTSIDHDAGELTVGVRRFARAKVVLAVVVPGWLLAALLWALFWWLV